MEALGVCYPNCEVPRAEFKQPKDIVYGWAFIIIDSHLIILDEAEVARICHHICVQ